MLIYFEWYKNLLSNGVNILLGQPVVTKKQKQNKTKNKQNKNKNKKQTNNDQLIRQQQ